jgi:hypothetical protein
MYIGTPSHSLIDTPVAFDSVRELFRRKFSGETCLLNVVI